MMVEIVNCVGSGNLGLELEIGAIGEDIEATYTEYDPSNYHGLYVRLVEDGPFITVYRTGKYIISGCESIGDLLDTNTEFLGKLKNLGIAELPENPDFHVRNVVCTGDLAKPLDLNTVSITLGLESTEYEPEQFPGVIYRPSGQSTVLLIFSSGKVVITGAQSKRSAELAFENLKEQVESVHDST